MINDNNIKKVMEKFLHREAVFEPVFANIYASASIEYISTGNYQDIYELSFSFKQELSVDAQLPYADKQMIKGLAKERLLRGVYSELSSGLTRNIHEILFLLEDNLKKEAIIKCRELLQSLHSPHC